MFGRAQYTLVIVFVILIARSSLVASKRIAVFHFPDELHNEVLHDPTDTVDDDQGTKNEQTSIEVKPEVLVHSSPDHALEELANEMLTLAAEENAEEMFSEFIDHNKPPATTWEYMKESIYGLWTLIRTLFTGKRR